MAACLAVVFAFAIVAFVERSVAELLGRGGVGVEPEATTVLPRF